MKKNLILRKVLRSMTCAALAFSILSGSAAFTEDRAFAAGKTDTEVDDRNSLPVQIHNYEELKKGSLYYINTQNEIIAVSDFSIKGRDCLLFCGETQDDKLQFLHVTDGVYKDYQEFTITEFTTSFVLQGIVFEVNPDMDDKTDTAAKVPSGEAPTEEAESETSDSTILQGDESESIDVEEYYPIVSDNTSDYEDVKRVTVSWSTTPATITYKQDRVWNPNARRWESTQTLTDPEPLDAGGAIFYFSNDSSEPVTAEVIYTNVENKNNITAEASFEGGRQDAPNVVDIPPTLSNQDGINEEPEEEDFVSYTKTLTVSLTINAKNLKNINQIDCAQLGSYTIMIREADAG